MVQRNYKKLASATLYKPKEQSLEVTYLKERRAELGGFIPNRQDNCPALKVPSTIFEEFYKSSNNREASTTPRNIDESITSIESPNKDNII